MCDSKAEFSKIKQSHFSPSKRHFPLGHAAVKKRRTSPIYRTELLFWINNYAKVEFSTENVFLVFANLENIFGGT